MAGRHHAVVIDLVQQVVRTDQAAAAHALAHRHARRRLNAAGGALHDRVVVLVVQVVIVVQQICGRHERVLGQGRRGRQSARFQLRKDLREEARLRINTQHAATQSIHDQKAAAGEEN